MKTAIYLPPSAGCDASARILASALAPDLRVSDGPIRFFRSPHELSRNQMAAHPSADMDIECAFFLERVLDHPALMRARHRILIPNPEWLDPGSRALAGNCTQVWHKSRFSQQRLAPLFPQATHAYLGFMSEDPGVTVSGYETFVHLRGKVFTQRNTESIFAAWKARPSLPDLYVHFYWDRDRGVEYPGWLHDGNVHVRMGWLARTDYLNIARSHGIHLCTSEAEGFGHYIDEARAMSALVVTVDGAPMNELIDEGCGILVPPSSTVAMNEGIRHRVTPDDLLLAVDRAMSLTPQSRREMGAAARERYLADSRAFRRRARELYGALAR
jgi:hypothetical protein